MSSSSSTCFNSRNSCPSSNITSCRHSDVTVACCKSWYIIFLFFIIIAYSSIYKSTATLRHCEDDNSSNNNGTSAAGNIGDILIMLISLLS